MTMQSMWTKGLLTVVAAAALVACGGSDDPVVTPPINASLIGRYAFGVEAGFSEIVAHHAASQSVFITVDTATRPTSFQRVSLRNLTSVALTNPVSASNLESGAVTSVSADVNDAAFTAGAVQTLAISGNLLAIAVQANPKTDPGLIAFYRLDSAGNATYLKKVTVGSLPDGVAFSPDGSKLVVANEGEQNLKAVTDRTDPEGSISIINVTSGTPADTATTLGFQAFNVGGARAAELPAGVRISRLGASVAQDMEPEFVTVAADNQTAYVTLQENNAVAVVNLATSSIERIVPMGEKNHGLAGNELAPSDKVAPPFTLKTYNNLFGYYMPDGIVTFSIGTTRYFITANEGDDRNDFLAAEETNRVSELTLDLTAFPNAVALQDEKELGRLNVFNNAGDTDGDGDFDRLYALGGRSFSIYNATTGAQVYDSGSELERIVYSAYDTTLLNASQVKGRLDNKGPEPENVVVGEVKGKLHAFIGLERSSAVAMFDISNPAAPVFVQLLRNSTNLTDGDISPEGLTFVAANLSPTGQALLLVGYEVSGSVGVYEIK